MGESKNKMTTESYPSPLPENSDVDPGLTDSNLAEPVLDSEILNNIMHQALEPGVLFGEGLELTDQDREQLGLVIAKTEAILEPAYQDPRWQEFMSLVDEGNAKGVLMAFSSQGDTNVPSWCFDGGDGAKVRKVIRKTESGEKPGIEVPSGVFNVFHWHETANNLDRYINTSNETLRHTSSKHLGLDLEQLAWFVKQSNKTKKSSKPAPTHN